MYSHRVLKTLLIPAAALVEEKLKDSNEGSNLCRPSELPIYVPEPPPLVRGTEQAVPTYLEEGFGTIRQHFTNIYKEVRAYKRVGTEYLEQSKDKAEWLLKYLRQEDNTLPKAGAIAIGGLTGFIFGLRGRFIKRTLYTTTGALTMSAVCYPKEASEYSQVVIAEAKKYATIAYNFAYGGGDSEKEVTEIKHNELNPDVADVDVHKIVAKSHATSSQSCDCPVGASPNHPNENIIP